MLTATRVDSEGEATMGAQYYGADSENGDRIDDPSEDALFTMISDLNDSDNTFVVVQPDEDDPVWFASVAVLDDGGFEIVRRDTTRNEVTGERPTGSPASRAGWYVFFDHVGERAEHPVGEPVAALLAGECTAERIGRDVLEGPFTDRLVDDLPHKMVLQ